MISFFHNWENEEEVENSTLLGEIHPLFAAGAAMSKITRVMINWKMSPTKSVRGQGPNVENNMVLNLSGKLSHSSKFQDFGKLSQGWDIQDSTRMLSQGSKIQDPLVWCN